jgi:integrase
MATEKVSVSKKWHGAVPKDDAGKPLPKAQWVDKRPFSWAVRWFGLSGERFSKSFQTRKEAERFAEAKQAEVRVGRGDPPKRCTLQDLYREHETLGKASLRRTTLHGQLATLALLAEKIGWDRDVSRVNHLDIEAFSAWRSETIEKPTIKKELKNLKRLFNLAIARRHLTKGTNPCDSVPIPKVGQNRIPYCSIDEFGKIYSKAPGLRWRTLVVLWYTTGLRREESAHLTWDDISFETGYLIVARRPADQYVQAWEPKDHELRAIPIPEQLMNLLCQLKAEAPKGCPYVFMDEARWAYYRQQVDQKSWSKTAQLMNNWLRRFQTICRRAGVREYAIQDLRRSCITNWARRGVPIHVAQKLAGHADIETTQTYYLAAQESDFAAAKRAQEVIVGNLAQLDVTDPKLTQSVQKRDFPKRKASWQSPQPPTKRAVA